jgi:hypothetical protein
LGKLRRRENLGDLNKVRRMILKMHLKEAECVDVGWIQMLQGRVLLWDLVNTVKSSGLQRK